MEEAESWEPINMQILLYVEDYSGILKHIHNQYVIGVLFELEEIGDVFEHQSGGWRVAEVKDDQVVALKIKEFLYLMKPLKLVCLLLGHEDPLPIIDVVHACLAE